MFGWQLIQTCSFWTEKKGKWDGHQANTLRGEQNASEETLIAKKGIVNGYPKRLD